MTIKIGIIGTGGMARFHAEHYKKDPVVELTTCLDVVPGRADEFAKKWDLKNASTSLDQLLDQVDAVSIVTPDLFHSEPTIKALQAGKHVLCEKPLTVTLDEARAVAAVAQAAAKKGVRHMVNFSYRRSAAFQKAMEMCAAGDLGKLRHIHSSYLQGWLAGGSWGKWHSEAWLWRLQTAKGSGGVLGDLGCHILDMTTGIAGEVAAVRCDLRTFQKIYEGKEVSELNGNKLDANDTAIIEIEFTNGAVGLVHTTRWASGHNNSLRCEAHGTEGSLMIDLDADYDKLNLCQGEDLTKHEWKKQELKATPSNHERFIESIKTGKNGQPDIFRGAQIQAYLDACFRSAKSGKWEKIQPWMAETAN
jgi:predicted dehydrogenase